MMDLPACFHVGEGGVFLLSDKFYCYLIFPT